jgi:hypothetical protein
MQLNDILEENSIKAISQKTKISEENLENLFAKKFEDLKKIKTFGFISIIEREYNADLSTLRKEANEYYGQIHEDQSIALGLPTIGEKRGKSKFLLFLVLGLLGYASWYFMTQFDKKHLSELIPFLEEDSIENFTGTDNTKVDAIDTLSITKSMEKMQKVKEKVQPVKAEVLTDDASVIVAETVTDIAPKVDEPSPAVEEESVVEESKKIVSIVPVGRLWFGLIDMEASTRDHFSVSDSYDLDVTTKSWLVATSSAPFSLKEADKIEEFNDAKSHYFKISKEGMEELTKSEYVSQGGYRKW